MKIQAAVLERAGAELHIDELTLAPPRAGELLVQVAACGVCHTDEAQRRWGGPVPTVLGHETSGVVRAVGEQVRDIAVSDRVVLSYAYCGACAACLDDRPYDCENLDCLFDGLRLDGSSPLSRHGRPVAAFMGQGGFAAYCVCPAHRAVKVEDDLDLRLLGPLGCGLQTGAGAVLNYLRPEAGSAALICGAGSVGLSAVLAARISGCAPIIVIDRWPERLALAEEFGASRVINAEREDAAGALSFVRGRIDYAFDSSGSQRLLDAAVSSLAPGGQGCGVGIGGGARLSAADRAQGKSWAYLVEGNSVPRRFIPQLINYYRQGRFPFDRLVSFFGFRQINAAFDAAREGRAIKPVVVMEEAPGN